MRTRNRCRWFVLTLCSLLVADAQGAGQAWQLLLGRPFRGLDVERYGAAFAEQVSDPALAQAATRSNLKLIGRATYLVQSHVNEVCEAAGTAGLDYARANSLLFEASDYRRTQEQATCPSEISLAVGMGLARTLREQAGGSWDEIRGALEAVGLERYKAERMPAWSAGENDTRGGGRGA